MLRDGVNVKDAAALLGHSITELLYSYINSNDEALRAAHALHGPVDKLLK
jgi:site-specific recombinase XerD